MALKMLKVTDAEFKKFSTLIEQRIGIKFPPAKRSLLEGRLSTRLQKMGFNSFDEYYHYLLHDEVKEEFEFFVDKITTHTTHFFREEHHFIYLLDHGLDLINKNFNKPLIKILSLGSSTGEEMYTIAMILQEEKNKGKIGGYQISAADISKHALLKAKEGTFNLEKMDSIPKKYRKYFHISAESIEAVPELKKNLRFFILNACKRNQNFPDTYHIVFCRNMLIYFSKQLQQNVIDNISSILIAGGIFITGHSESLLGLKHNFKTLAPTIYSG